MKKILVCLCCWVISPFTFGQKMDSVEVIQLPDTLIQSESGVIPIKSYADRYNPRRALLLAAVIPGVGQIYNKRYWKLPLVYGGFALGIYVVDVYHRQHVSFRKDLFTLLSEKQAGVTVSTIKYSEEQLRNAINKSRRERDFYIIITGFWYLLQMIDAHVDAHLKEFKLNPQLKMSWEPVVDQSVLTGRTFGVGLVLKF